VSEAPRGWTYVRANRPGPLRVAARVTLARVLGF
jgi:hypothetical protein